MNRMIKINDERELFTCVQYGKGVMNIGELYDKLRDQQLSKKKYILFRWSDCKSSRWKTCTAL
jgi:hypothetical protein